MSAAAVKQYAAARESARRRDGRFGVQARADDLAVIAPTLGIGDSPALPLQPRTGTGMSVATVESAFAALRAAQMAPDARPGHRRADEATVVTLARPDFSPVEVLATVEAGALGLNETPSAYALTEDETDQTRAVLAAVAAIAHERSIEASADGSVHRARNWRDVRSRACTHYAHLHWGCPPGVPLPAEHPAAERVRRLAWAMETWFARQAATGRRLPDGLVDGDEQVLGEVTQRAWNDAAVDTEKF